MKWKLSFPKICIVVFLGVVSFLIINFSFNSIQEKYVRDIVESRFKRIMADIDVTANEAANQAALFVSLPEVQRAYEIALAGNDIDREDSPHAQEAREYLRQALAPMLDSYEKYAGKRLQLHFHLPNAHSLVRLWRDKQTQVNGEWVDISDNLTLFRTTVIDVNATGEAAMGVELGSQGLVVRGVLPIISDTGQQLGSVEVLEDINPILDAAVGDGQSDLVLYINEDRIHVATVLQDRAINPRKGDFIRAIGTQSADIDQYITPELLTESKTMSIFKNYGFMSIVTRPLLDYRGEQLGVFVYIMDTRAVSQLANTARLTLAVTLIVMFSLMLILNDVTALTRAKNEAEAASSAKSEFLSRMSHEMRTPLNAIIGMAAIGVTSENMERKQYCLDKISDASKHLLGVINDVLDISKIEADKLEPFLSKFSPYAMLDNIINVMRFKIEEKKQHFDISIAENLPQYIIADEQRIAQIITNFLSNAVKFTPENGTIGLKVEAEDVGQSVSSIRISVSDTGIGISEEQQKKLFNPFEQANSDIFRRYGGTGLGLTISKRIAEMMDACIEVSSELGKGSTFTVTITVDTAQPDIHEMQNAPSVVMPMGPLKDIFNGKRVLLAEDIEINREIIHSLLEDTGLEIVYAQDGAEALDLFCAAPQSYDLILMDVQMPNMDGDEATKKIRSSGHPGAESIPVIALTANVFREDIERYLSAGMNGHLGKPIDPRQLTEMLAQYLIGK